jgi:peptidoglycan/LPS O-acetylase OafA/YrhL
MSDRDRLCVTIRMPGLDALRAIAVLLTFTMHFSWLYVANFLSVDLEKSTLRAANSAEMVWAIAHYYSLYGVYLFFMISGMLIGRKWLDSTHQPTILHYLRDRAARIFPAFWAALAATAAFMADQPAAFSPSVIDVLGNASLLNWFAPHYAPPWLIVSWSLQVEWLFYLLMPLLASCLRQTPETWRVPALWLVAIGLSVALKGLGGRHFAYPLFFALGIATVLTSVNAMKAARHAPLGVFIALLVALQLGYAWLAPIGAEKPPWEIGAFDAFTWGFLLVGGMFFTRVAYAPPRWLLHRAVLALGRISYSFYLWHLLVLIAMFAFITRSVPLSQALSQWNWVPRWWVLAIVGGAVSWAVSWVSYQIFEVAYFRARGNGRASASRVEGAK